MECDLVEIQRTLAVLFQPGETVELRAVGGRTINGYYRDMVRLSADAQTLNASQEGQVPAAHPHE